MALTLVFAGTPEFAAHHLQALLECEHQVVAVYTQPDRPAGRGRKLTPSAVKTLANAHDIPVYQPPNFKTEAAVEQLAKLQADLMVVVAYGLLLPASVLQVPRFGCINVHASLLPRWRGAAPIQRALLAGDTQTGITIMQMDSGLDTGAMLLSASCPILLKDTAQSLHDRLLALGSSLLVKALGQIDSGRQQPTKQDDSRATYAAKLHKDEGKINWATPAAEIDRQIRAFTPWPGAYTFWQGERVRIHQAHLASSEQAGTPGQIISLAEEHLLIATAAGNLAITCLQLPGKKAMPVAAVLNARREHFNSCPRFE